MRSTLTVGSLFTGVGGFDLGFQRAGFDVRWQVEIEPDAVAVLTRHWPAVRRYRDINAVVYGRARNRQRHGLVLESVDVVVGGFPCQDLSIAGRREGLSGARSGLFFAFMRAVRQLKPSLVVIENVPGLLSSQRGADFHTVLTEMANSGLRRAYRILDSQYFGVAQRRRRVFLIGSARALNVDPGAVLFEPESRSRDSAARGKTRARVAATLRGRTARLGVNDPGRGGEDDVNLILFDETQITSGENRSNPQVGDPSHPLVADGRPPTLAYVCGPLGGGNDGIGRRTEDDPNLVYPISGDAAGGRSGDAVTLSKDAAGHARLRPPSLGIGDAGAPAFTVSAGSVPAIAATLNSGGNSGGFRTEPGEHLVSHALTSAQTRSGRLDPNGETYVASPITASAGHHGHSSPRGDGQDNLAISYALNASHGTQIGQGHNTTFPNGVRRLTPLECERLQGFPDGWTCICGEGHRGTNFCSCPDTPRYKALGNAVTVNVIEWLANRARLALMNTQDVTP